MTLKQAEELAHALGITLWLKDARITQHDPGGALEVTPPRDGRFQAHGRGNADPDTQPQYGGLPLGGDLGIGKDGKKP